MRDGVMRNMNRKNHNARTWENSSLAKINQKTREFILVPLLFTADFKYSGSQTFLSGSLFLCSHLLSGVLLSSLPL